MTNDTLRDDAVNLTKSATLFSPVLYLAYSATGLSPGVSALGTVATAVVLLLATVTVTAIAFNIINP